MAVGADNLSVRRTSWAMCEDAIIPIDIGPLISQILNVCCLGYSVLLVNRNVFYPSILSLQVSRSRTLPSWVPRGRTHVYFQWPSRHPNAFAEPARGVTHINTLPSCIASLVKGIHVPQLRTRVPCYLAKLWNNYNDTIRIIPVDDRFPIARTSEDCPASPTEHNVASSRSQNISTSGLS